MDDKMYVDTSARGFDHHLPVPSEYGGGISVSESSAAGGPHLWVRAKAPIDLNDPDGPTSEAPMHLTAENAWLLARQLLWQVVGHYQGDSRPDSYWADALKALDTAVDVEADNGRAEVSDPQGLLDALTGLGFAVIRVGPSADDPAAAGAAVAAAAAPMDSLIKAHIIRVLEAHNRHEEAFIERCDAKAREGFRLVESGQEGEGWAVRDWDTNEVIAQGEGGYEQYIAALERLDPDGKWVEADNLRGEAPPFVETPGVPEGLAHAIEDWIDRPDTTNDDIAAVIGWTAEKVEEYR